MTVRDVIEKVKQIRRPTCADQDLINEIERTEYEIRHRIIDPRGEQELWTGFNTENDTLTAPRPWDEIYVTACLRYISRLENNITNLNNEEREYKEIFAEFAAWWRRTHVTACPRMRSGWYGV